MIRRIKRWLLARRVRRLGQDLETLTGRMEPAPGVRTYRWRPLSSFVVSGRAVYHNDFGAVICWMTSTVPAHDEHDAARLWLRNMKHDRAIVGAQVTAVVREEEIDGR